METNLTCDEIYDILEHEIAQLKILPGETISENPLCKRFHISRTPVRSVLQRLQYAGFVQIVPHKGTIVTPISLKLASQWIFQRMAVECMVLRDFPLYPAGYHGRPQRPRCYDRTSGTYQHH